MTSELANALVKKGNIMPEYDYGHANLYDYFATGLPGDIQFYVEEAIKAGSPVLEIGCGTGRILIPTAEANITVFGLDRSPDMLSILRSRVERLSVDIQRRARIIEGDMRNFSFEERFNLVMVPYRAINHLLTPEDQRQALTCIREHLTHTGCLIFNTFDPRWDDLFADPTHSGTLVKDTEFIQPTTGNKYVVWETHEYDVENQLIMQYYILEELNNLGQVLSKTYIPLVRRYSYPNEIRYLLELCGYDVEALHGDFDRRPFKYGCEQIWVARRS